MIVLICVFGFMSSSIFEKIVSIVSKVVAILEFSVNLFFKDSDSSVDVD